MIYLVLTDYYRVPAVSQHFPFQFKLKAVKPHLPYVKLSIFIQQQRILNVLLYNKALCLLINKGQDFFNIIGNENIFPCLKKQQKQSYYFKSVLSYVLPAAYPMMAMDLNFIVYIDTGNSDFLFFHYFTDYGTGQPLAGKEE